MSETTLNPLQPLELDLSTEEITEALAKAPVYAKKGLVHIRKAIPGEQVKTVLADGTEETVNTAGEDQVVITNPGGEKYIIDAQKASVRYEETDKPGVFRAKGMVRAIKNPTGQDFKIMAPWGEEQFGDSEAMVATLYDPEQPDVVGDDRYIIGGAEFQETYGVTEVVDGQVIPAAQ